MAHRAEQRSRPWDGSQVKGRHEVISGLDIIAITYITVKPGRLQEFENRLYRQLIKKPVSLHYHPVHRKWYAEEVKGSSGCVVPFLFVTTTGAYDYILMYAATSSFTVTQFCSDVLRYNKVAVSSISKGEKDIKGFGKDIIDTHTTIGVDNNPVQKIAGQLKSLVE